MAHPLVHHLDSAAMALFTAKLNQQAAFADLDSSQSALDADLASFTRITHRRPRSAPWCPDRELRGRCAAGNGRCVST